MKRLGVIAAAVVLLAFSVTSVAASGTTSFNGVWHSTEVADGSHMLLLLFPTRSASAKAAQEPLSGARSTIIYTAKGRPVGRIVPGVLIVEPLSGDPFERVDIVGNAVWLNDAACFAPPCGDGYARIRPGGFWYVNRIYPDAPQVRTIGIVRRRTSRTWDAYLGLGSHAHRVGYASGRYPAIGAAAFLVDWA